MGMGIEMPSPRQPWWQGKNTMRVTNRHRAVESKLEVFWLTRNTCGRGFTQCCLRCYIVGPVFWRRIYAHLVDCIGNVGLAINTTDVRLWRGRNTGWPNKQATSCLCRSYIGYSVEFQYSSLAHSAENMQQKELCCLMIECVTAFPCEYFIVYSITHVLWCFDLNINSISAKYFFFCPMLT